MLTTKQIEWRRGGIGSSDAGVIAGHSTYRNATPMAVWSSKVFAEHNETTGAMELGNIFERSIGQWYLKQVESGLRLIKACGRVHKSRKWQRATPDFYVYDGRKRVRLLECKLVGPGMEKNWDGEDPAGIPPMVQDQIDWQMDVTGIDVCDVAAVFPGSRTGNVWRIEKSELRTAPIREACRKFWFENVIAGEPPPLDGSDASNSYLDRTYAENQDQAIAPPDAEELAFKYNTWTQAAKMAKEQKALLGNKLKDMIGNNTSMRGRWGTASWKERDGSISWKKVAEEMGTALEEYGLYPSDVKEMIEKHRADTSRVFRLNYKDDNNYEPQ